MGSKRSAYAGSSTCAEDGNLFAGSEITVLLYSSGLDSRSDSLCDEEQAGSLKQRQRQ